MMAGATRTAAGALSRLPGMNEHVDLEPLSTKFTNTRTLRLPAVFQKRQLSFYQLSTTRLQTPGPWFMGTLAPSPMIPRTCVGFRARSSGFL